MKIPSVDKTGQWLARVFFVAFAWFLLQMLLVGEYSYHSMGHEKIVSSTSNPIKFYFGIVWCSVMLVVSGIFAFFAKRK